MITNPTQSFNRCPFFFTSGSPFKNIYFSFQLPPPSAYYRRSKEYQRYKTNIFIISYFFTLEALYLRGKTLVLASNLSYSNFRSSSNIFQSNTYFFRRIFDFLFIGFFLVQEYTIEDFYYYIELALQRSSKLKSGNYFACAS